jgi:RinA family phage transcriptional activator
LKRATYRYIEAEIYDYPSTVEEITRLRQEIIEGGSPDDTQTRVQSNRLSDPTADRATRLVMDKRLRRLEEVRNAIDRVYQNLDPDRKRLVEMKYWEKRLTHTGIAEDLHISERTFYRWKDDVVKAVALELGLLKT